MLLSDHLPSRQPLTPSRALQLTAALGISTPVPIPRPELLPEMRETVNISLLAAGVEYRDPVILLCPQADELRAWPTDYWISLMKILADARPERIAVLGGHALPIPEGVVPVMPVQDSLMLATLLARASLVIATDSATLHLADIQGVPTLGLFGPTAPNIDALPNDSAVRLVHAEYPCHPCGEKPCAERHCLYSLTSAEVARAVSMLLTTARMPE